MEHLESPSISVGRLFVPKIERVFGNVGAIPVCWNRSNFSMNRGSETWPQSTTFSSGLPCKRIPPPWTSFQTKSTIDTDTTPSVTGPGSRPLQLNSVTDLEPSLLLLQTFPGKNSVLKHICMFSTISKNLDQKDPEDY